MSIPAWLKRLYHRHGFQPGRSIFPRPFQPLLEELEARRLLATHVVSNTLDAGLGSLRQAILDVNNDHDTTSAITFNIPGSGQQMIQPASALPVPNRSVMIDGTSQPNFAGPLLIVLDGSRAGDASGLVITAGHSTIKGLVISNFSRDGIVLMNNGDNVIQGNYIGTDVTGVEPMPNHQDGIVVMNGSANNTIGGTDPSDANVISGNGTSNDDPDRSGVLLVGPGVTGNQVLGNYIGTDWFGLHGIGNGLRGVYLKSVSGNTIGGAAAGAGNIISGNLLAGVQIDSGSGNVLQGNTIGLDATGGNALANGQGILINVGSGNTIGGTNPGAGNTISGNTGGGVSILSSGSNVVQGNLIGTDTTGTVMLGNGPTANGIFIYGNAPNNLIGGPGAGNVIDSNQYGIFIAGTQATGNQIQGNLIGVDVTGTIMLGNRGNGVLLNAPGNTVGGTAAGAGNIISGCGGDGVTIYQTSDTLVQGNFIGVDASGLNPLGNTLNGVNIYGGHENTIGGADPGAGNVLSANGQNGIALINGTFGNAVEGNLIGTGADGVTPLGNFLTGVRVDSNAQYNQIGGVFDNQGNVIAYTQNGSGVAVTVGPGNAIRQNAIWGNAQKGIALSGSGAPNLPVLTSAVVGAQGVTINGTYSGSPNMAYALEFFANDQPNASGYGEGQYYLGTWTVVTDNTGNATFMAQFTTPVSAGQYVSATATLFDTTSEFAQDVVVNGSPNTAFQSVAAALLEGEGVHLAAVIAANADHPSVRHDQSTASRAVVWAGADGSSLRLETGSQSPRVPLAHATNRDVDGFFEEWDKLF